MTSALPFAERVSRGLEGFGSGRALAGILVLFAVANAAIFLLADPSCYALDGACSNQHDIYAYPTAETLLKYGSLIDPTDPLATTYRQWPPVSGMVMAGALLLNGGTSFYPLIVLQVLMLLATGFMVRTLLRTFYPWLGNFGLCAVIFNPNALGGAHLLEDETFAGLLMAAAVLLLYRYARVGGWPTALAFGAVFGASLLVRPTAQLLIPFIPFVFPLLGILAGPPLNARRAFADGLLAVAVCLLVLAPWIAFQLNAGVGWRLAGAGTENLLMAFNLSYLTDEMPGEGNGPWRKQFEDRTRDDARRALAGSIVATQLQVDRLQLEAARNYLLSLPFSLRTFGIAWAKSTGRFFISGGEGEIHSLFGLEGRPQDSPLAFYGIKVAAVSFAVVLRIFGLIGAVELVRRRQWTLLVLCVGTVLYFWGTSFVLGKPRFRLMIEPELMVLASFGVAAIASPTAGQGWAQTRSRLLGIGRRWCTALSTKARSIRRRTRDTSSRVVVQH